MKRFVSLFLVVLLLASFGALPAFAAAETETALIEAGFCADENGFCVTSGAFFETLEALMNREDFRAATGVEGEISVIPGNASPEIRVMTVPPSSPVIVSSSLKGQEEFPTDEQPFTLVAAMGTLSSQRDYHGLALIVSAILYLTNGELDDAPAALQALNELVEKPDVWESCGALEYQFTILSGGSTGMSGDTFIFAVREAAAYAEG